MLAVDLKEAFDGGKGNWFTVLLLRLIAKSDSSRTERLARGFPVEVEAVRIYKNECPYKDAEHNEPDWEKIEAMALARGLEDELEERE